MAHASTEKSTFEIQLVTGISFIIPGEHAVERVERVLTVTEASTVTYMAWGVHIKDFPLPGRRIMIPWTNIAGIVQAT